MSTTQDVEIRGPEQCSVFDPDFPRTFSILPDCDADEAYCVRHDREMVQIDPVVRLDGALYTTTDRFSIYSCPDCLAEFGSRTSTAPKQLYQWGVWWCFDRWDQGDAPAEWFRYVGEGGPGDVRGKVVTDE